MKTLLLTLVVVTIVCLDLGDSLICYLDYNKSQTCPPGQEVCYTKRWCEDFCGNRGKRIEWGCAATCPTAKPSEEVECCSTDMCNVHPNEKPRHTRTCFKTPDVRSEPCPPGEELCYTKSWCGEMCSIRGNIIELGCAATCPPAGPKEDVTCCSTDNCNTHP